MAGLRFPLSTLHVLPRGCPRMTRGRDGAAIPFTWGSFIPYSMPVLSRRFLPVPSPHNLDLIQILESTPPAWYNGCKLYAEMRDYYGGWYKRFKSD